MDFPTNEVGASISVAFFSFRGHNEGSRRRNGGVFIAVSRAKYARVVGIQSMSVSEDNEKKFNQP